jgi:2,4-dienoyl-CoA reductase-like NADH-dependent reductase (Old Yellow Enzyme family)
MLEVTAVQANGRITPEDSGIWLDAHIDTLKKHVDFAHSQNALIGIQLGHAGRKASTVAPWLSSGATATEEVGGWPSNVVGPSEEPFNEHYPIPRPLTLAEIAQFKSDHLSGVRRALRAGFDVIELHFAHGYLVSSFLSPAVNKRTDQYGGSFENRIRLALEIIDATREVIPADMPLFVRISATDWLDTNPSWNGGPSWTVEDSIKFAELLAQRGVDVLDVSSGGNHALQKVVGGPGYQAPFAKAIKAAVKDTMLVSSVGSIKTGLEAQKIIDGSQNGGKDGGQDASDTPLDLIAAGRMFLKNPGLVWAWADELGVTINVAHQIGWGFGGRASKKTAKLTVH